MRRKRNGVKHFRECELFMGMVSNFDKVMEDANLRMLAISETFRNPNTDSNYRVHFTGKCFDSPLVVLAENKDDAIIRFSEFMKNHNYNYGTITKVEYCDE